jgi:DNA-binding NarL/FixJ family response regulator
LILSADLMFGSRLLASLKTAGHSADLLGDEAKLRTRLSDGEAGDGKVLIADLTDDRLDGASTLESLRDEGLTGSLHTLAFFSHVEADVRERAQRAGFDLIVARSRMAREAAAVVAGLTDR